MIEFHIIRKNGKISKYYGLGHAKYKKKGERYDLLCNTVSVVSQQVVAGFVYLGYEPKFDYDLDSGFMIVDLEDYEFVGHEKEVNVLLGSMQMMMEQLAREYPKYIKLIEEEEN